MKKLLALALVTAISLPVMAAETAKPAAPGASNDLSLSTPIAGEVTVGTALGVGAVVVAAAVAVSNSGGGGGNDSTPGTTGPSGTTGTTGTTGTN